MTYKQEGRERRGLRVPSASGLVITSLGGRHSAAQVTADTIASSPTADCPVSSLSGCNCLGSGSSCLTPPFSLAPCRAATLADEGVLLGAQPGSTSRWHWSCSEWPRQFSVLQSLKQGAKGRGEGDSISPIALLGPNSLASPTSYKVTHSLY